LGWGDFGFAIAEEVGSDSSPVVIEGHVDTDGEHAGPETIDAAQSNGDEGGGDEAVSAGVLRGADFAFGSARAGALEGVSTVGCELLVGNRHDGDPFTSQIASELG
jgi:hypothetical protein